MKNLKKSHLAWSLAALTIVSTVGLSQATLAAGISDSGTDSVSTKPVSTVFHFSPGSNKGVKPVLTAAQKADLEAKKADFKAKQTEVENALKSGNYEAWVAAVGTDNPLISKITAANFSRYVEIYNLHQQEQAIMAELGLTNGGQFGFGTKHPLTSDSSK